jgi:hypothetical protein
MVRWTLPRKRQAHLRHGVNHASKRLPQKVARRHTLCHSRRKAAPLRLRQHVPLKSGAEMQRPAKLAACLRMSLMRHCAMRWACSTPEGQSMAAPAAAAAAQVSVEMACSPRLQRIQPCRCSLPLQAFEHVLKPLLVMQCSLCCSADAADAAVLMHSRPHVLLLAHMHFIPCKVSNNAGTVRTCLQAYRESARAWPCHLYAFAAPNERALEALAALGPLIEVGCGLGYWAHLLRQRGVDIIATDETPTAQCAHGTVNKYHGSIPSWTSVEQAAASCTDRHGCAFGRR